MQKQCSALHHKLPGKQGLKCRSTIYTEIVMHANEQYIVFLIKAGGNNEYIDEWIQSEKTEFFLPFFIVQEQ